MSDSGDRRPEEAASEQAELELRGRAPGLEPAPGETVRPGPEPEPEALGEGEVHLWSISLLAPPSGTAELLADDETARAERFRFDRDRRRFVAARGALRRILGRYVGRSPEALAFRYGARGKPELEAPEGLAFNLSHSHEMALLGVTRVAELGVDVERLRPMPDLEPIAERFFARGEHGRLMELPEPERVAGFFRCWTRKEAYVKAVGEGLALPLDSFEVTLEPGTGCRFLDFVGHPEEVRRWRLHHVEPEEGYVGAVALPAEARVLRLARWEG